MARGVYFARGDNKEKGVVDFFVLDPKRQVMYSRRKKSEGVFSLTLTTPGQYTFIFSNLKVRNSDLCMSDKCILYSKNKERKYSFIFKLKEMTIKNKQKT